LPLPPPSLSRLIVALDTDDWDLFGRWCRLFGPRVGLLKVGLEAYVRWGPPAVELAGRHAHAIFLDLKLHDIPNTVAGAVAAARDLGVRFLTVHAGGGPEMMAAAAAAAGSRLELLAVTLLTHLDEAQLAALDLSGGVAARVERWADLAARSGCAGVVCSPREAGALRRRLAPPFLLVTPGVRPAGSVAGDQRRVATPAEAIAAGADYLVIGRPLTAAADAERALAALAQELEPVA
jgi:orotidine-5'-phosphate decarboxylase